FRSPLLARRHFFFSRGCLLAARRRERRGRTNALFLRIALSELLRALVIEIRAHDHVAQDAIGVAHAAVERRPPRFRVEHEQVVVALVELLDGICESAAAPRLFVCELGADPLSDALELADQRRRFLLRDLRREDEQDFVSPHVSSFWPSGSRSSGTKELADCP